MKSSHKHTGLIVFGALLMLGGAGYYFVVTTKKHYAMQILQAGHGEYTSLMGLDKKYLKAWAHALNNGQNTFKIGDKIFSSSTGKQTQ